MVGFYRSTYTDSEGKPKSLVVSQFEATDARRAFPCWDEPAIKATFEVTLEVKKHFTALSNMNVVEEKIDRDLKVVKFAKTPKMSTYLVAFAVGEFGYIEAYTSGKFNGRPVQCRLYTIKGSEKQGEFALDVKVKTLEYFAEIFDIAYPLPKCDSIAVPDFEAGAMENWGLITFRTTALLFDRLQSSARAKQGIAYTMAHELAHQWFGNYVSPEWWSHLWLNEGFATWVGYLAVDHLFPDWDIFTQFVMDGLQRGLGLDALRSSHPIEVEVSDPAEIHQIFDAISYYKGASVIRMLANSLGMDTFLKGVSAYLKRHAYANAATSDLWQALSEESGMNVGEYMEAWTKSVGHPVVTVTLEGANKISVRQNRYLSTGDLKPEEDTTIWWIPLRIISGKSAQPTTDILRTKEATFDLPPGTAESWTRTGPAFTALRTRQKPSGGSATRSEVDPAYVWNEIATRLTTITSVWFEEPQDVRDKLLALQRKLFTPVVKRLGWDYPENESFLTSLLRTLAISRAGKAHDPEVVQEGQRRFGLFVSGDTSAIHPNLRGTVFDIVISHGGAKEYDAVLEYYRSTTVPDQKVTALAALGSTRDPSLIQRTLDFALTADVRPQDIIYVWSSLGANHAARSALWSFTKAHWGVFDERYRNSMAMFGIIVKTSTEFATEEKAAEVEAFFEVSEEARRRTRFFLSICRRRRVLVERTRTRSRSRGPSSRAWNASGPTRSGWRVTGPTLRYALFPAPRTFLSQTGVSAAASRR
ncbi:MAG: peptidase family M1-domain-containing protein [Olpidium bornovanus]|uniref:Aminopeptidase n=1 Tax=Olpidium bornovanus TaxID=278681 RepID=A0A8H8DME4_9FUNG|nr:MAG: peptidase family M1-domain-containing protein [Olpidium bornovanus]